MFKLKEGKSMEDFMKVTKELCTVWKDVVGWEGYYSVSNFGDVKSLERKGRKKERILKPYLRGPKNGKKYLSVRLCKDVQKKQRKVHHLVLEAFVGPRPIGMVACHGKKGPLDNSVANLYWGTYSQNNGEDKLRDGTMNQAKGEKNGQAKLKEAEAKDIYNLAWKGELKQKEIAKMFGITQENVSAIKLKKRWSHLKEK